MNRTIVTLGVLLSLCIPAVGNEEVLRELVWSKLREADLPANGEVLLPDGNSPFERLMVENTESTRKTITVATIDEPGVTMKAYAVRGEVAYDGVEGDGYLELVSVLPGGARYSSPTIEESGLLQKLSGTSDWREFLLPVYVMSREAPPPERLIVNVVLPGRGKVYLRSVRLTQYGVDAVNWDPPEETWFNVRAGMWIGSIGGSLVGVLGGLIGMLVGMGKARGFVLGTMKVLMIAGVGCTAAGVVSLIRSQPYAVYYPLLLVGGLSACIFGGLRPVARRRYEQIELRKMQATDG